MNLHYTPESIGDLQRLHDFIAPKNPLAAKKAAIEMQEAANRLKTFPEIGLPIQTNMETDQIRDLYVGQYSIRYQVSHPDSVYILRIWHNKEGEKDKE